MKQDLYILDASRRVKVEPDLMKWAHFMEKRERIVKRESVGNCEVSTVFLGMDHNFSHEGPPLLWETMVFGGKHDQEWMDRCSGTWERAEAMHQKMVDRVKGEQ